MKKVDLENKVEKLEKELIDLKIEQHRKGYIHIPFSWGGCLRFLFLIGSIALSLLCLYAVFYFWDYFKIWNIFLPADEVNQALVSTEQLFFLYPFVTWFFSVWFVAFVFKVFVNGGFDDCDFSGLAVGLAVGLISGLAGGLAGGLISGLVFGLVGGLVVGLVVGLVFCLAVGFES